MFWHIPYPKSRLWGPDRKTGLIHNPSAASGTIRFNDTSADRHQPFKPLHGERQRFIELFDDPAGRVQAAVLQLERVAVALVEAGQTGELRRQQGAVVERHDVGRGALLGEGAQRVGGRSGGRGVQEPRWDANHHLFRWQRGRVLPPGHARQLHRLARIWRTTGSCYSTIADMDGLKHGSSDTGVGGRGQARVMLLSSDWQIGDDKGSSDPQEGLMRLK